MSGVRRRKVANCKRLRKDQDRMRREYYEGTRKDLLAMLAKIKSGTTHRGAA